MRNVKGSPVPAGPSESGGSLSQPSPRESPSDYMHPDWTKHATKVAASAYRLLKWRDKKGYKHLENYEAHRLKQHLDALHEVSCGGDPDYIQRAMERSLAEQDPNQDE